MKMMKKLSVILLSICLCMPCFSMVAHAAHGRISFTDPETAVGEMVEVQCVVRSTSGTMGSVEVNLSYDSAALRFQSGDGVTDNGNGSLTCEGTGGSAEISFTVEFQALTEGETKVTVASTAITDTNGATLTMDHGNSTVKIAEGDPSKITDGDAAATTTSAEDMQVEVNGVTYTLTDNFADADIPSGYSRTQMPLDGQDRQMVTNDINSIYLAYLTDADLIGDFFLYNEEDATFAPYEEITISDTTSIVVLSDTSKVELPATYQEAKLTLNEKEFPVWQDTENDGYYVLYAMNNNGEEGYYRYDSNENTYQKFEPEAVETEEDTADDSSLLGKIKSFIEENLALAVLVVGLGAILLFLILIILAVKLRHRNAELDELYDEYGIDEEEEELPKKKDKKKDKKDKKDKKAGRGNKPVEEEFEEDFEEDDFEEEFEEEDFEEDFEEDDYEEFEEEEFEEEFEEDDYEEFEEDDFEDDFIEGDFEEEVFEEENYEEDVFAGYDTRSELMIDDLDALLGESTPKRRGHMETDDTFKVDFIDLD